VGLAPGVILFGWFYLRNLVLYGDIGASQYLLTTFRRQDRGSVIEMLNRRSIWLGLYEWLLSASTRRRVAPPASHVLTAASAVGLGIAAFTGRLHRRPGPEDTASARRELRWTIALCLVPFAVVAVTIAQHVSGGGNAHARYAMPAVGAAAVLAVVGLERLWSRWGPMVLIAFAGWWAVVNIPVGVRPFASRGLRDDWGLPPRELRVLPMSDGWRDLAGALVAVGVTVAAVALVAAVRSPDGPAPATPQDAIAAPKRLSTPVASSESGDRPSRG
jgi:hypothetical protein